MNDFNSQLGPAGMALFWFVSVPVYVIILAFLLAKVVAYGWHKGRRQFFKDYPQPERKDGQADA